MSLVPSPPLRAAEQTVSNLPSLWTDPAPDTIQAAVASGDAVAIWRAWQDHLLRRKSPRAVHKYFAGKTSSLLWGIGEQVAPVQASLIEQLDHLGRKHPAEAADLTVEAQTWLDDSSAFGSAPARDGATAPRRDLTHAVHCLAWARALPALAGGFSPELWWRLCNHLQQVAVQAKEVFPRSAALVSQLLAGELPMTLAAVLPELSGCRALAPAAVETLSASLVELLDGEGLPHASDLDQLRPLLACWTRCRVISSEAGDKPWADDADMQYRWLVTQALRLCRHDGSQVFSPTKVKPSADRRLFSLALKLADDKVGKRIGHVVLDDKSEKSRHKSDVEPIGLPEPAISSEWSAFAQLRSNWRPASSRFAISYAARATRIEFATGGETLFAGDWSLQVRREGKPAAPTTDWENVCWVSDEDVDYLEIEIELEGGLRVQRQILLAREDGFLMLADAVLGEEPQHLDYEALLPLASGVRLDEPGETRESFLVGQQRRALVMPLGLSEWRSDSRGGRLAAIGSSLALQHGTLGRSLFAPLWFDLKPRRMQRQCTWRQLTVAANREIVSRDTAVGYRVQVGNKQWMMYRSLASVANRTVLGHNLATEFIVGRFSPAGDVSAMLEIE